jgi:hypothetical protein
MISVCHPELDSGSLQNISKMLKQVQHDRNDAVIK